MMILGESNRPNPTVQIPSWTVLFDDPTAGMVYGHDGGGGPGDCSPFVLGDTFAAALHLHRYLPSNAEDSGPGPGRESDFALALDDEYSSSDEFRMFEFKVRRCGRGRAHDWTECPFAHLGEKAKRRDPRKFHYSGTACPDFRKGSCRRGEACDYAHGVFECWLHPARYRTQPCKDGTACRRRVCFFAHTPDQLRLLPQHQQHSPKAASASASIKSYDGSPLLKAASFASSPTSTLLSPPFSPSSDSPPLSPNGPSIRRGMLSNSVNEVLAFSFRQLQLSNAKSSSPWGVQVFSSSPSTPTTALKTAGMGLGWMDLWEKEAETMDRVESGRDLRAKVFEKLSRENAVTSDVGSVSELVK